MILLVWACSQYKIAQVSIPPWVDERQSVHPKIARFIRPTWGPPGSCRPQVNPMLAQWTLLLGLSPVWYHQETSFPFAGKDHLKTSQLLIYHAGTSPTLFLKWMMCFNIFVLKPWIYLPYSWKLHVHRIAHLARWCQQYIVVSWLEHALTKYEKMVGIKKNNRKCVFLSLIFWLLYGWIPHATICKKSKINIFSARWVITAYWQTYQQFSNPFSFFKKILT